MARPNKCKRVLSVPICPVFAPIGSNQVKDFQNMPEIIMSVEEFETLRLIDYMGMTQEESACFMNAGRATIQSLYTEARRKLARVLVEGAVLKIQGGNYSVGGHDRKMDSQSGRVMAKMRFGHMMKGEINMKIAVTYENGNVFQHFGHTEQFKIYTVEEGKITSAQVVDTNGSGHGALAGFLNAYGVEVLICGGIGAGAKNALAEIGIELYAGACGDADAQVESFLSGNLVYNPNTECNHHHGSHGCGEHGEGHHGCGGHGEGHHGCGGHGEGHHGCGGHGENHQD